MTASGTNQSAGRRRRTGSAARYPALGQPATTAGALRAAADLIERSAVTGLSVTCDDGYIHIQVTNDCGDAPARAAVVACPAGYLGSVAVQEDSHFDGYSCITASGNAGGLRAEVFTPLAVQHADPGPGGQQVPLAVAPDGLVTQVAPPAHLPAGYRWLTDLDPSPAPAAIEGAPGHAVSATRCPAPADSADPL